ncbi:ATP-grasp domain-containing protein [Cereibacter sphaeroides]|uniref:ATP-grasp domain-containing protein n=1 Tax=Cereibacter sphaeroides TaxID=1063 RepID=UPI001F1AA8A3|nr:ATP-grasp domain-containing protein [Cereibacter sphaeroides]MCE6959280.1 ATP-grasp domain-containing protein [Cereibacter sphaeroides]MCE6972872.1 ATP-grasp domain-containing protein [Cereibacter sphaeroides]
MHWIVQNNLFGEQAVEELVTLLRRHGIRHDVVKLIPFGGGIEPDVEPEGPVVVIGAFGLSRHAQARGWAPGSWMGRNGPVDFDFDACCAVFGEQMLNHAARVVPFRDALEHDHDPFFIRPASDGKAFAGTVLDRAGFAEWRDRITATDSFGPDTPVVVGPVREILSETRFIVVDGKVVAGSVYRRDGRLHSDTAIEPHVLAYARDRAQEWTPDRVCVMDIADTPDGLRIIEFNNFNSAGWYGSDVSRIVQAIEALDVPAPEECTLR